MSIKPRTSTKHAAQTAAKRPRGGQSPEDASPKQGALGRIVARLQDRAQAEVARTVRRLRRATLRRTVELVATDEAGYRRKSSAGAKQVTLEARHSSPSLYVKAPPHGWVYGWLRITLDLDITAPSGVVRPRLAHAVVNRGRGFDARTVRTLHLADARGTPRTQHVVFMPPGAKGLRIDLPSVPAQASIRVRRFLATEITKQEATLVGVVQHLPAWRADPKTLARKGARLVHHLRHHGLMATLERLERGPNNWVSNYQQWVALHASLSSTDVAAITSHMQSLRHTPTFSVVMPVYNPPGDALRAAIASVTDQLYPHWQLCIVDDASTAPHVAPLLAEAQEADGRVEVISRAANGHICEASNDGLRRAKGDFVVLLDHDDLLTPHALYMLAHEINVFPAAQVIFSDEDKITEGGDLYHPYFKHGFDEDLLLGQNCVSHLGCYKTQRLRAIGGFRRGYEGSQDHDLVLRATRGLDREHIRHIPHVLYHWRAVQGSTAASAEAKPYAQDAGLKAVQDHLHEAGVRASACRTADGGLYRVQYAMPPVWPKVSVIIPTRDHVDLLAQCISSLRHKTRYQPLEILVIDNNSSCPRTLAYLAKLAQEPDVRVLPEPGEFNFAAINNRAAQEATGEILCLLNNDIEAQEPGWLEEMVSHVLRPGVGIVGARLLYPDGKTIQHAGVILGLGGIASHAFQHETLTSADHFGHDRLVRRYSAVTGACLVVSKALYTKVGGLDPALKVAYNDIDFCLRVGALGHGVVWTPFATLLHHESASRGKDTSPEKAKRFLAEQALMMQRWGHLIANDPCYNPNLTLNAENFALSVAPRAIKPWAGHLPQTAPKGPRRRGKR